VTSRLEKMANLFLQRRLRLVHYFIIVNSSMFLTVCYSDVEKICLMELKGRGGKELGPL
jgi:hypothetical protein